MNAGMGHHPRRLQRQKIATLFCCTVFALIGAMQGRAERSQITSSINLKHALSPQYPCRNFLRPIQFFSETTLIILSGPEGDCYRSVGELSLNLTSIDGKVSAKKAWQSTDPGLVIAPGRLVLGTPEGLEVDGRTLTAIQSLKLPQHHGMPILSLRKEGTVTVDQPLHGGQELLYGGVPLRLLESGEQSQTNPGHLVFELADGQTIMRDGESLDSSDEAHGNRVTMSLTWVVPPCEKYMYCQAYDAGVHFQVSTGKYRRVLVFSNGSKFPVTDAAGLFPYFRLQIFDLDTGKTLYREEDFTRTGERYASISPDGDRLATTDGQKVIIRSLP